MAEGYWIVCPFCGLSRKIDKTGAYAKRYGKEITSKKERIRFDKLNPEEAVFIDVRETGLGRGAGFPRINELCKTIKEAKDNPEYKEFIEQIKNQILKIQKILKE